MAIFCFVFTAAATPRAAQQVNAPPACYHQELDAWAFLTGDWTVRVSARLAADGPWEESAASAQIQRDLHGCLFTERFNSTRRGQPFQALSLFAWNGNSQKLQQVFSDSEHGPLVFYEGEKTGAEIRVDLDWKLPDGRTVRLRRAYFDFKRDSFTVESRRSTDGGQRWDTTGRLPYRRTETLKRKPS